jgi:hypothetical protein
MGPPHNTQYYQAPMQTMIPKTIYDSIFGVILYYSRDVDRTMLVELVSLVIAALLHSTALEVTKLLNRDVTLPDATIY